MGNSLKPGLFSFNNYNIELQNRIIAAYPEYHIFDVDVKESDISNAVLSWKTILESDNIEAYVAAKRRPDFEYPSCLSWFFSLFYEKFFELCPESEDMFANSSILAQGRLLAGVITSSFDVLKNPRRLEERLIKIVTRHNPMKIKAAYYGLMGEALLLTLQFTLGSLYTNECALAWTKIYSFLLSIIIPRAVEYEYKLSLSAGRGYVSHDISSSEISSNRYSIVSISSTIDKRIRNSVSHLWINENSAKKTGRISASSSLLSKKCTEKILEEFDTRKFESNTLCPFSNKRGKIDTVSNQRHQHQHQQQEKRSDLYQASENNILKQGSHHHIHSVDLSETDDIEVPAYVNHTVKCPRRAGIVSSITSSDNNITENISYDNFKLTTLSRFTERPNKREGKSVNLYSPNI